MLVKMYEKYTKRCIDVCMIVLSMPLSVPLFIMISLVILVTMGRPILFLQKRIGYKRSSMSIIKFRSMAEVYDLNGNLLPDMERVTRLGSFLRKSSLDELPNLINVFLGELSLVGPRPLLCEYMPLYSPEQARRHDVRPGITGWAQINGRNSISWSEKFKLDIWYVDNISFLLDLKIIIYTILKVIKRTDINQNQSMTMEKFNGSN